MQRRVGIQTKIVLPYVCLFLLATALTVWATIGVTSNLVEDRWRQQLIGTAQRLGPHDIPAAQGTLDRLKSILGADFILVPRDSQRLLATVEVTREQRARLPQALSEAQAAAHPGGRLLIDGRQFAVYSAPIPPGPGAQADASSAMLHLLVPADELQSAKRSAAWPVVLVAAASLVLVLAVGIWIARRITHPVREMAEQTSRIAAGELDRKVPVRSRDELAELADSFNRMVDGLRESQRKLIGAERLAAIGELAAGVAHDIRNPLSAIRMNVQILRDGFDPDHPDRETCAAVLEEIERMELAVADLLEFARPRDLVREPTDLPVVVRSCLRLLHHQMQHAKVEAQADLPDDLPPINADAGKLRQLLMNLLINAINAMPRGGRLEVAGHVSDGTLELTVRDTGEGIAAEHVEHIFDPFVTTRAKGTGLGLAIARRIVEEHGGRIGVKPAGGDGGSVFTVHLPIQGAPGETA